MPLLQFLCEGLEEDIIARRALAVSQAQQAGSSIAEQQARVQQLTEVRGVREMGGKGHISNHSEHQKRTSGQFCAPVVLLLVRTRFMLQRI